MRRWLGAVALLLAGGCTPGSSAIVGPVNVNVTGRVVPVDVNLTSDPGGSTPGGAGAGYSPLTVSVNVGDGLRFTNSDGFAHTATEIPGAMTFPSAYPFTNAALNASGSTLSGGFSTGSLAAGASSGVILADVAGTYLFGCYYHYGSPMRAAVVVH